MQMKNIFLYERLVQVDSWRKVDQAAEQVKLLHS